MGHIELATSQTDAPLHLYFPVFILKAIYSSFECLAQVCYSRILFSLCVLDSVHMQNRNSSAWMTEVISLLYLSHQKNFHHPFEHSLFTGCLISSLWMLHPPASLYHLLETSYAQPMLMTSGFISGPTALCTPMCLYAHYPQTIPHLWQHYL